jgi:hypothetical protein
MVTLQIDKPLGDRSHYWLAQKTQIAHSTIRTLAGALARKVRLVLDTRSDQKQN